MKHKLFIDTPSWFIRPKNTDWIYTKRMLPSLSDYSPKIEVELRNSFLADSFENGEYIAKRFGLKKIARFFSKVADQTSVVKANASNSNIIYSHRNNTAFFLLKSKLILQTSLLDPTMSKYWALHQGLTHCEEESKKLFLDSIQGARTVIVSTQSEKKRLSSTFPNLDSRIHYLPFFQPYLNSKHDPQSVIDKHSESQVRILFVGREAHRKGLDILLESLESLPSIYNVEVRILGSKPLSKTKIPLNVIFEPRVSRKRVLSLMQRSHILVHPARFESYGFVITEAMANGMAIIAPAWEVQSELLDYGVCGVLIYPDVTECRVALESLISDSKTRTNLALQALSRWNECYHPGVVADAWLAMLNEIA